MSGRQRKWPEEIRRPFIYDDLKSEVELLSAESEIKSLEDLIHYIISRIKLNSGVPNWFNGVPDGDNQTLLNRINGIQLSLFPKRVDLSSQNDGITRDYTAPEKFDPNSLIVIYGGLVLHQAEIWGYTVTGDDTFRINKPPSDKKRIEILYWKKD